uniref:Uncharacterized protein n=1 Tax=Sphaerodactylus townsendi TaxID=933632 RepID=A0ACB8ERY4_9SAUR
MNKEQKSLKNVLMKSEEHRTTVALCSKPVPPSDSVPQEMGRCWIPKLTAQQQFWGRGVMKRSHMTC